MNSSHDEGSQHGSSFEAAIVSSSPFLRSLSSFVWRESDIAAFSSEAESGPKPPTLSCLSPEVLARLRFVENAAGRQQGNRTAAAGPTEERTSVGEQDILLFSKGGRVEWSRVRLSATGDSGVEVLADGARLAVACHAALQQQQQQQQRQGQLEQLAAPTSPPLPLVPREVTNERLQMPGVVECIVRAESSDEQVYVALCVCLTILERALYDIYRKGVSQTNNNYRSVGEEHRSESTLAHEESSEVKEKAEGIDGHSGSLGAPAMILRDLIATPEVKAALPEQLVAILRLLLLPTGFNVRNLVWHGFLAPCELPRELASLVLVVTLSISADSSPEGETGDVARFGEPPELSSRKLPLSPPMLPKTAPQLDRSSSAAAWWELDSFDDRLACPRALTSAVDCLLSAQHRGELKTLVGRSAFVLPGREKLTMFALRALGGERDAQGDDEEEGNGGGIAFFLVAVLPVLEHGLRVLFSCANDSPGHMFAHAQRYYSTLDGFGQRARHQLLLDQEMSGCPDRPNLLLSALGPGMSACLLDLFMMSAGPNLRGKVAHGEIDVSRVFRASRSCPQTAPELVQLTAALFLVLCRRYDACRDTVDREQSAGVGRVGSSNSFSRAFAEALDESEAHCSGWVPRFHPHELLEVDLRASRDEFDGLALALERRAISVEILHGSHGRDLARMSVEISGDDRRCGGRTCEEDGELNQEVHGREEQEEEEEEEKKDAQPSEGRVVLTVTDTAGRLVVPPPPRAPEAVEHDARLPPSQCGAALQSKNVQGSTSGMFASILRVDEALREHGASLARRFQRHQRSVEATTRASAFAAHYSKQQLHPAVGFCCGHECLGRRNHRRLQDRGVFLPDDNHGRISPPTNVITCAPLPQRQMMATLCKACAEGALGLRERIAELEALLSSGSARSGQRRAYAATLQVAPTILRFLASAVACVELFVIEWDQQHSSDQTGLGTATSSSTPNAVNAAGLSFLRRLAAVNGALGLCIATGAGAGPRSGASTTSSSSSNSSSKGGAGCKEKSGGSGKKGFAQALAELASFLETKAARQGFAGCWAH
ncbi:unnamed protein product [Ectocarpus sp. 4 AP-2014]